MFYAWCNFTFTTKITQSSKVLIEHTSRSTEDKPKTYKCVGVLRWSIGCFNQQSLLGQPTEYVSQQPSKQPHSQLKVNPRKVNAAQKSQRKTTASSSNSSNTNNNNNNNNNTTSNNNNTTSNSNNKGEYDETNMEVLSTLMRVWVWWKVKLNYHLTISLRWVNASRSRDFGRTRI